jgi:tRNA A-37 threonylcarbamoyl transferase component Bud32
MDSGEKIRLEDGRILSCVEAVRSLPGKRQVFLGDLDGVPVFAKLYLDPGRRKKHWQRELDGINVFQQRGILTAELLYAGEAGENGNPLILLARLPEPVSLKSAWEGADSAEKLQLLRDMVAVLAGHHNAGAYQSDLHLDNFVISEGSIYSLDGAGVGAVDGALDVNAGLDNLALFLAQLFPQWEEFIPELYELYLKKRGQKQGPGEGYLLRGVEKSRERRWDKFRGKLFRDCTAIRYRESPQRLEITTRVDTSPELDRLLANPDASFPGRDKAFKNGNTCTVWATKVNNLSVVIKRYKAKSIFKGLLQKIVRGRALSSWENAHLLGFYGFHTPRPVAVLKLKDGPWKTLSYFISEEIDGICLYYWLLDEARSIDELTMMAGKVADVFKRLYSHRITHGDMKEVNLFVVDNEMVLIDLDSMIKHRSELRFRRAWRKDLRRFMQNWKKHPDLLALFQEEFKAQGLR